MFPVTYCMPNMLFLLSLLHEGMFLCFYEIWHKSKVIGVRDVVLRKRDSCCGLLEIVADRTVGAPCLKIDHVTSMLRSDPDLFLSAFQAPLAHFSCLPSKQCLVEEGLRGQERILVSCLDFFFFFLLQINKCYEM